MMFGSGDVVEFEGKKYEVGDIYHDNFEVIDEHGEIKDIDMYKFACYQLEQVKKYEEKWNTLENLLDQSRSNLAVQIFRHGSPEYKSYFRCISDVIESVKKIKDGVF